VGYFCNLHVTAQSKQSSFGQISWGESGHPGSDAYSLTSVESTEKRKKMTKTHSRREHIVVATGLFYSGVKHRNLRRSLRFLCCGYAEIFLGRRTNLGRRIPGQRNSVVAGMRCHAGRRNNYVINWRRRKSFAH
jgi:hypothetical protein